MDDGAPPPTVEVLLARAEEAEMEARPRRRRPPLFPRRRARGRVLWTPQPLLAGAAKREGRGGISLQVGREQLTASAARPRAAQAAASPKDCKAMYAEQLFLYYITDDLCGRLPTSRSLSRKPCRGLAHRPAE